MRWRLIAIMAIAAAVLFVVGYWLTQDFLVEDKRAASAESDAASPDVPAPRQCGPVATTDAAGQPLAPVWLDQVRAVHDAACRRAYDELAGLMSDTFRNKPPVAVVDDWRTADPEGVRLDILSAILETSGKLDQGGLVFCQDDGIVAFARGTHDRPGKWSEFAIFIFYETTELTPSSVGCA